MPGDVARTEKRQMGDKMKAVVEEQARRSRGIVLLSGLQQSHTGDGELAGEVATTFGVASSVQSVMRSAGVAEGRGCRAAAA
jgi:hypothetical protein